MFTLVPAAKTTTGHSSQDNICLPTSIPTVMPLLIRHSAISLPATTVPKQEQVIAVLHHIISMQRLGTSACNFTVLHAVP